MENSLVYYGSEVLKSDAAEVSKITQQTVNLVDEMFAIMKKANGIGLAAPQVGISERIIVIEINGGGEKIKTAIINPVINAHSSEVGDYEEGCLSIPGVYADVVRPLAVEVSGLDLNGKPVKYEADRLFARVLQHEIDHLDGILFIDRIEDYIRKEFTRELKRIKKLNKL